MSDGNRLPISRSSWKDVRAAIHGIGVKDDEFRFLFLAEILTTFVEGVLLFLTVELFCGKNIAVKQI